MIGVAYALIAVFILILVPWIGVQGLGLTYLFGVIIPYAAMAIFFSGFSNVSSIGRVSRILSGFRPRAVSRKA